MSNPILYSSQEAAEEGARSLIHPDKKRYPKIHTLQVWKYNKEMWKAMHGNGTVAGKLPDEDFFIVAEACYENQLRDDGHELVSTLEL